MSVEDRVRAERDALVGKIEVLEAFRSTSIYRGLPEAERDRLTAQLMFMRGYAEMLRQRIAGFRKLERIDID
jgi:hypothetical protein